MTDKTTNPPGFDFDSLDLAVASETPFEFELVHPESKQGLGVFVSVIGSESETFQAYIRREANAQRLKNFQRQRKGGDDKPTTIEEEEAALIEALAVCVKGWRTVINGESKPVIVWAGVELPFGRELAVKWLAKFKFIRAQVNEATGDLGNFIKG